MAVTIVNRQKRRLDLPRLRQALAAASRLEGEAAGELVVVLGGDSLLAELNHRFRGLASPTDVLAFPAGGGERWPSVGAKKRPLGEIAISTDTAARQARAQGHSLDREVGLLAIHGLLHLRGWRDDSRHRLRMQARLEELMAEVWKERP